MEPVSVRARALNSVPSAMADVEARFDGDGRAQLQRLVPASASFLRWLGWRKSIRLDLDPTGTAFWQLIDGRRPLRDIAVELARKIPTDLETAELAVVDFTRELMARELIGVRVHGQ